MSAAKSGSEIGQLIEQLAETVRIDDLAERLGIPIKRVSGRLSAQCIFHNDTNPSMVLYPGTTRDKSHYHCFVCDAHGDIFELVKQAKGLDFTGAIRWLASSYGLPSHAVNSRLPPRRSQSPVEQSKIETAVTNSGIFEQTLAVYRQKKSPAFEDWLDTRRLPHEIVVAAELGFSEPATLLRYVEASQQDFGAFRELVGQLENVGLIRSERKKLGSGAAETYLDLGNQYRDFFNDDRAIFPIRDVRGRLIGFAGRRIKDSAAPKYLYTPSLPKSQLLYRADVAFSKIKSDLASGAKPVLYVCEGLVDALRLESFGLSAVAVLGARLSNAQAQLLIEFAATLPALNPLQIRFFLDMDGPGLKGAAASIDTMLKLDSDVRVEMGFIWPADMQVSSVTSFKDPDDLLKQFEDRDAVVTFLDLSTHPVALAFLAERLNVPPSGIIADSQWDAIPLGAKYRLAVLLEGFAGGLIDRVLTTGAKQRGGDGKWLRDVTGYVTNPASRREGAALQSSEEIALQLNIARELARAGANKGEVLSDIAAWRRISLAATAFNEGFTSRLKQAQFQPIEPFDAVLVSRGFGKEEGRLKAMPCPEDLVIQQYVMNELLTERLDHGAEAKFSNYIPAVRYYRSLEHVRTTGETEGSEHSETLSFAYQVDMDALEGRKPPGEGGMFRPYFECWKGFISSLLRQGREMNHVHMVRLDLKRYYDSIKRIVAKDILSRSIESAYQSLGDSHDGFVPLFRPGVLQAERQRAIIDFLLDQSFGFNYYHPNTGDPVESNREEGIPQGPVLSAWLGNIILFRLDAVMRSKLATLNSGGVTRAGYARYVDDVVLLAESVGTLDVLRAAAEDVTRILQLELVSKESFAPMSTAEFSQHLTSGRALPASGPREEAVLLESGDGDAGWGMWQTESPRRQTSLELLRDPRLYALPVETIQNQVYTALRAEDLRPAELGKASRWLWYQAAQSLKGEEYSAKDIVSRYWEIWKTVCSGAPFVLDVQVAWDDPAFHALEGLENLLERANSVEFGLSPEEAVERTGCIAKLARVARSLEFAKMFERADQEEAPPGWGCGTQRLRRMFFQRVICMRWKATRLTDETAVDASGNETAQRLLRPMGDALQASLRRSLITDAETWGRSTTGVAVTAGGESDWNVLGDSFQWLHRAIVALATEPDSSNSDPLSNFERDLEQMERRLRDERTAYFSVANDKFLPILRGLLPHEDDPFDTPQAEMADGEIVLLSLQTLAAIAPRPRLAHLLSKRKHLLQQGSEKLPIPPLPGVPARGLLLVTHTSGDDQYWTKISTVWWVTLPGSDSEEASLPSFRLASVNGDVQEVIPDWHRVDGIDGLQIFSAVWDVGNLAVNALLRPPALPISARSLAWVADAYESIARLNHNVSPEAAVGEMEFAPAWPYLIVNTGPHAVDGASLRLTLLSPRYPRASLDGLAFVRDGMRGLRTYDVPELYGRHWRTGVLLSDLFGFQRDLDQFAVLKPFAVGDHDTPESLEPATHLLRNVLRKLRGGYANGHVLHSQPGSEHLPASVARSLDLLRKFPRDGEPRSAIAYVLSSEAETAGMRARLAGGVPLEYQGIAAAFFEQVAIRVVSRVPLAWAGQLNEASSADNLPTLRVIPRSYWALSQKFSALRPASERIEDQERSFAVLIAGMRLAAVAAWVRELVFSIEALSKKEEWPLPVDGDMAEAWQLEERGLLFEQPDGSVRQLTEFFREKIVEGAPQQAFANITPLGWLVLLAGRVGLLGGLVKRPLVSEWSDDDGVRARELAISLSTIASSRNTEQDDVHPDWPFELDRHTLMAPWLAPSFAGMTTIIGEIEGNLRLQHTSQVVAPWKLDPSERSFTDASGDKWEIAPWQILLTGGLKPDRTVVGKRLLSIWDETRDADGSLLVVSAREARFSKLLTDLNSGEDGNLVDNIAESYTGNGSSAAIDEDGQPAQIKDYAVGGTRKRTPSTSNINETDSRMPVGGQETRSNASSSGTSSNTGRNNWRELQQNAWQQRRAKSPGHIRIALMQWDLHESYHHPAIDAVAWDGRWPPSKKATNGSAAGESLSTLENSAIEYRRRQFLAEALTACENFGVDLLVVPEYSVRPDTVGWLKGQLHRRAGAPSVLAGTYKLHGNSTDLNFDRVYREILGLAEYQKTFGASLGTAKGSGGSYISGEHSAILTLLSPLDLESDERVICTFSRRKKYPSLAAAEVFNPPIESLKPLFSTSLLLDELNSRFKGGQRVPATVPISARQILHYSSKLRHLECVTEFVCSELFLPMSLANHNTLAAELLKLARRFGSSMQEQTAMESVQEDIKSIAKYLGISDQTGEMKRRSVLIVPAMTTRSADYWIFGQATLLAGGATTVFCNAVVDKHAVGGSCFIGRNSWNGGGQSVHHDANVTPYAGWSKGIYYNSRSDALGECEQAMVIADVDPLFMQEGKPRPQALANPLQLVAYLPIVEVDNDHALKFDSDMHQRFSSLASSVLRGGVVNPSAPGVKEMRECISRQLAVRDALKRQGKSHAASFDERFDHWKKYWSVNVIVGIPPVVVDWLWVEGSPKDSELPSTQIFVPDWSGDTSIQGDVKPGFLN